MSTIPLQHTIQCIGIVKPVNKEKMIVALLNAIRLHRADMFVVRKACTVLENLLTSVDTHSALLQNGGLELLIDLATGKDDGNVHSAQYSLEKLARYNPEVHKQISDALLARLEELLQVPAVPAPPTPTFEELCYWS